MSFGEYSSNSSTGNNVCNNNKTLVLTIHLVFHLFLDSISNNFPKAAGNKADDVAYSLYL